MGRIVSTNDQSDSDLVEVVLTEDLTEAEMVRGLLESSGISSSLRPIGIDGPLVGIGLLPRASHQVMVRADQADAARSLLADTSVGAEQEVETANAGHLADAEGRGARNYGLIGAYARIWFWSLGALAVMLGVFLLLRAI